MTGIGFRRFAAGALAAAALAAGAQQLYRWTDASGRVHYSTTPPPPGAKDVQKRAAPAAAAEPQTGGPLPFALQQAVKDFPITLYTTPGCEACAEARKLLNARGIPFKEVSVVEDAQIEELKQAVGSNSVPAMIVGRTVLRGFEEGGYHRALDAAGYPKTGVLPPRNQPEPAPGQPAPAQVEPLQSPAGSGPYSPERIPPAPARR